MGDKWKSFLAENLYTLKELHCNFRSFFWIFSTVQIFNSRVHILHLLPHCVHRTRHISLLRRRSTLGFSPVQVCSGSSSSGLAGSLNVLVVPPRCPRMLTLPPSVAVPPWLGHIPPAQGTQPPCTSGWSSPAARWARVSPGPPL